MSDSDVEFSALLKRFGGLSRADRSAVLESLDPEERISFEHAVIAEEQALKAEQDRKRQADRQFLGYSPWLADQVEAAVKEQNLAWSDATTSAVVAEHKILLASRGTTPREGWRGILDRMQDLFAPGAEGPR